MHSAVNIVIVVFGPGRVPKRYDGCSSSCCSCYPFSKNAYGFVNTQRKVTKLSTHIRDIIPDRSTVLDFYQMAPPSGSVGIGCMFHSGLPKLARKQDGGRHIPV